MPPFIASLCTFNIPVISWTEKLLSTAALELSVGDDIWILRKISGVVSKVRAHRAWAAFSPFRAAWGRDVMRMGGEERSEVTLIEWADDRLDETKESNWSTWVMTSIHRGHDSQLAAEHWKQHAIRDRVKMRRWSFGEFTTVRCVCSSMRLICTDKARCFGIKSFQRVCGVSVADSDLDLIRASIQLPEDCSQDTRQTHTVESLESLRSPHICSPRNVLLWLTAAHYIQIKG